MKRYNICFVVIIFTAILLIGCSDEGVLTPSQTTEEANIINVIQQFALALNNHNWSIAKSYCVDGSDAYYAVSFKEDAIQVLHQYCNVVTLTYYVTIINVSVYGDYAEAYIGVQSVISACGYSESVHLYETIYLQKIGDHWKIYTLSKPTDLFF